MPISDFELLEKYRYQCGFNSYLETEAVEGALPVGQNSPQKPPLGLYAEKLSGTAFTAPRHENKQTWLYRILPSCAHPPFEPVTDVNANRSEGEEGKDGRFAELREDSLEYVPNQIRWDPFDLLAEEEAEEPDFVTGLRPLAGAGDPRMKDGLGIYVYLARRSMDARSAFYSADGDMLIVPQQAALDIRTELGHLLVRPSEIAVVPRGVRYRVDLVGEQGGKTLARGYALEIYHGHFSLPELGPIGSNGLANPRDFQVPVACFDEDYPGPSAQQPGEGSNSTWQITAKFANTLHVTRQVHTPFDVVAWHGSYYPFKYDLGRFNTIGSISYDHPDPSIFTVLSATGSGHHGAGTALADFVIFPPRWLVAEHSFRPPYFHRNVMAEFMGLIAGEYDAKKGGKGGFEPGGASLHNVMAGHGPDGGTVEGARAADPVAPRKVGAGGMAFMFETCLMLGVTGWGRRRCRKVQEEYSLHSWGELKVYWEGAGDRRRREYLLK